MRGKILITAFFFIFIISFVMFPIGFSQKMVTGEPRVIEIEAFQFGFEPSVIRVSVGEEIIFKARSTGVVHGLWIDGQDIDFAIVTPQKAARSLDLPLYGETVIALLEPNKWVEVGPVSFDRTGKYKIRCSVGCGPLHPFMMGDIIVESNGNNYSFYGLGFLGLVTGVGTTTYLWRRKPNDEMLGISLKNEIDLLKIRWIGPLLKTMLQWRGIHFALILPNLFIFMIVLASAFLGNPMGALNFSIVLVWILWFTAVEFMILFLGRFWCTLCPIPAFGEWLSRRRLYGVHSLRKWFSLNREWPKALSNMWIAALSFLGISLIVPWLVTRPIVTGLLFAVLIGGALVTHLIFKKRAFCLYLCPAGCYIGHHSTASLFAIRSRDKTICDEHITKECIKGSPSGYGCPWKRYPGGLDDNIYCGQCFECLKSCPVDNMTLKLRMIGKDISKKVTGKADEAWMGFIRFVLAPTYFLVFFGSYFWIKDWGNMGTKFGANLPSIGLLTPTASGFDNWLLWVLMLSTIILVLFPAIFFAFSWVAKQAAGDKKIPIKQVFFALNHALTPYAMFLWISFGVVLITWDWLYPIMGFSNPMGWGWNLFGTGGIAWSPPLVPHLTPFIVSPLVFLGLGLAIHSTYNIGMNLFGEHQRAIRATSVMSILYILVALFFIWILMG